MRRVFSSLVNLGLNTRLIQGRPLNQRRIIADNFFLRKEMMTMSMTLITSRDQKGLHAVSLFEAAYNKAKLDDKRAQFLNERGGELQDGIAKLITELSLSNQFANEEVESTWTYPKEYAGPKPIEEQIKSLATILSLDPAQALAYAKELPPLPDGAEGWFAIMTPPTDPEKYCGAVQLLHGKIAASRRFCNYLEGQIDKEHLKVHPRTVSMMKLLAEQQQGDIFIIAAQLGFRHRGCSARRAREIFVSNEYGLGSIAGCSIALTHPERFVRYEELDMDLPGDEFNHPDRFAPFGHAPYLDYRGGRVCFGARHVGCPDHFYGSASGFVPQ